MTDQESVKNSLQMLAGVDLKATMSCQACTVKSVQGNTCTLTSILSEIEYEKVNLQSYIDAESGVVITPKIDSVVIMISMDECNHFVGMYSEISEVKLTEDCPIIIDIKSKKISIKNEQISLLKVLESLYDLLAGFKVSTPSGPSAALLPDTQKALEEFKMNFKKLIDK